MWSHIGGGCLVIGDDPFPCDDTYENSVTQELRTVHCTMEVHFSLPLEVAEFQEIENLCGPAL